MSKRIVFTFDDRSLVILEEIKIRGNFKSLAEVVRSSLEVAYALQLRSLDGYRDIEVWNPKKKKRIHFATNPFIAVKKVKNA
jgi:hypothetical protein